MEVSAILGRIEMERFIQVESFRKKGNTFRGIPLLSFLPGFPEISVLSVYTYQCQALHGNTCETKKVKIRSGKFKGWISLLAG